LQAKRTFEQCIGVVKFAEVEWSDEGQNIHQGSGQLEEEHVGVDFD
jgi:hypothetical protein